MIFNGHDHLIGVVIPTYNRENLIIDALNSVLTQTVQPELVVIVDDGSTDNTSDVVESWIRSTKSKNICKYVLKKWWSWHCAYPRNSSSRRFLFCGLSRF
ncbi:MAG: glycosyltransferase family 2 protein [Desulfuromonadaceae bacterium]|nr:glycosyltransferase family 2 protein [Desulfuromonadaceae bacterium]